MDAAESVVGGLAIGPTEYNESPGSTGTLTANDGFIVAESGGTGVLDQAHGRDWMLYRGDSCEVIRGLPDSSIDLCIHSPPFCNLYLYSDSESDMGNCGTNEEFIRHYSFLIRELYRITVPGRLCVVHCKDLPKYKGRDEAAGITDFPGSVIAAFEAAGWTYHSRVTIWKCPVIERARTNAYGLLHGQLCRDSAASRQGMPDYLVVFRKWAGMEPVDFPKPVHNPAGIVESLESDERYRFESYVGNQPPGSQWRWDFRDIEVTDPATGTVTEIQRFEVLLDGVNREQYGRRDYSIQVWQRYASPVWFDIDQTDVLNFKVARDNNDERHLCPLQLGVIRRCVHLWSNPGDVIFTPFAGVGSELVEPLKLGRKALGVELKDSYFETAAKNCRAVEESGRQLPLF